jgi:hypothetical protein
MRGSLWTVALTAIFGGLFAMGAIDASRPANPASSTEGTVDILATLSPVVGLSLFLAAVGAAWVISVSRSSF